VVHPKKGGGDVPTCGVARREKGKKKKGKPRRGGGDALGWRKRAFDVSYWKALIYRKENPPSQYAYEITKNPEKKARGGKAADPRFSSSTSSRNGEGKKTLDTIKNKGTRKKLTKERTRGGKFVPVP